MTQSPWRGVSFLIPGFDAPVSGPGGGFVLTHHGSLESVADRAAVRQALLLLLCTKPGERVMRPKYGCDLAKLMFWPNDDTTAGLAIHYVRQAISRWEPRVDHVRVDATRNPDDPSRLDITLTYRIRAGGLEDRLSVQLNLEGGNS
jgi:uncharacterized protein